MIMQATLLLALLQGGIEPQPNTSAALLSEQDQNIMRRFDGLPEEDQLRIADELQRQVLELHHPLCEAARALLNERKLSSLEALPKEGLQVYASDEYAPKLKLPTKLLEPTNKTWEKFFRRTFRNGIVDRSMLWDWDYGRNLPLKPPLQAPREVVIDLLCGRWPVQGKLAAYAEGILDRDGKWDAAADYFAHAYRDRAGRVYLGIPLYEVWNSQTTFGISDVESIAFMRLVAKDDRYVSPIPAALHDGIYKQIETQFEAYRDYRSLHHALAQRLVSPNGALPAQFAGIAETIDLAWVLMEHKPRRMAALLERNPTRQLFLAALAKEMPAVGKENELAYWAAHAEARTTLAGLLRSTALDFLSDEGLLGFRR